MLAGFSFVLEMLLMFSFSRNMFVSMIFLRFIVEQGAKRIE